jgi:pimeloyl-ACP methyl ester carboxylesterase
VVEDLRGASRLAVDATTSVTSLVEAMHRTIASGPAVLGAPLTRPVTALTGVLYGAIRGVTGLVGSGIDRALGQLAPLLGDGLPGAEREAVLAAVNGVLGDYLAQTSNPLAISMRLRRGGHPLLLERVALRAALPGATGRVLVLLHGSSMNDLQWTRAGHDHGAALARDHGYTPVYLHANTGLHVSTNGRELAGLLEQLVNAWPTKVEDVTLVGHSMGGLIARSAVHLAEAPRLRWRKALRAVVTLGTPHHGAPLERAGNWFETLLGVSRYSAPFAQLATLRSAGVTDLRHGLVLDEQWQGQDRFALRGDPRRPLPLPVGVACSALAGTTAKAPRAKLPSDGLVPVASALGQHAKRAFTLDFPKDHQAIAYGCDHLALLGVEAYPTLEAWLAR